MYPKQVESAANLRQYSYVRTLGAYRPHFQGIPEEYYPLSACEVIAYSIFVLAIIGGSLGLMIGLLFWVTNRGLVDYTIVWSIIFLAFVLFLLVAFYAGGRNRIREEKRLIVEQQKKQEGMKGKGKEKNAARVDQIDI